MVGYGLRLITGTDFNVEICMIFYGNFYILLNKIYGLNIKMGVTYTLRFYFNVSAE